MKEKGLILNPKGKNKFAHTPNTKLGMGNSYGTGVRQKPVKVKEVMGVKPIKNKGLKKLPKALA